MIVARNGLVSFIIHPDYIIEKNAKDVYRDLLTHLNGLRQTHEIWFALPGEIDRWWRARRKMRIVGQDGIGESRAKMLDVPDSPSHNVSVIDSSTGLAVKLSLRLIKPCESAVL